MSAITKFIDDYLTKGLTLLKLTLYLKKQGFCETVKTDRANHLGTYCGKDNYHTLFKQVVKVQVGQFHIRVKEKVWLQIIRPLSRHPKHRHCQNLLLSQQFQTIQKSHSHHWRQTTLRF